MCGALGLSPTDRSAAYASTVVLMAGLQGSGKTTNSAKLAAWFKGQGRQPLMVGADTRELLGELGYDAAEAEALFGSGAVGDETVNPTLAPAMPQSSLPTDLKSTPSERSLRYRCVRSMPTRFASCPTLPSHSTSCCCK